MSIYIHILATYLTRFSYVQADWDLGEVLAKKEEIVRDNLLVTKLAGPAKSA